MTFNEQLDIINSNKSKIQQGCRDLLSNPMNDPLSIVGDFVDEDNGELTVINDALHKCKGYLLPDNTGYYSKSIEAAAKRLIDASVLTIGVMNKISNSYSLDFHILSGNSGGYSKKPKYSIEQLANNFCEECLKAVDGASSAVKFAMNADIPLLEKSMYREIADNHAQLVYRDLDHNELMMNGNVNRMEYLSFLEEAVKTTYDFVKAVEGRANAKVFYDHLTPRDVLGKLDPVHAEMVHLLEEMTDYSNLPQKLSDDPKFPNQHKLLMNCMEQARNLTDEYITTCFVSPLRYGKWY
jgi:hypothetical protein